MFRSPKNCDRYEYIPIQLDTPIRLLGYAAQRKNGYQFTINDELENLHADRTTVCFEP